MGTLAKNADDVIDSVDDLVYEPDNSGIILVTDRIYFLYRIFPCLSSNILSF